MKRLNGAIDAVPAGPWAVAVSGGADSVALLRLLRGRDDLSLHVVHLDHQTRGQASTDDARFVEELAGELQVPCTIVVRSEIEPEIPHLPQNLSARYRAIRIELYRRVVSQHRLQGVILAHHADDQVETVLQRLIRGSGPAGLRGMAGRTRIGSVLVLRPLLCVSRDALRDYLAQIGQSWREDASNQSPQYLRNRLRKWLAAEPDLRDALLELGAACGALGQWTMEKAPRLCDAFGPRELAGVPALLARESARRWLLSRGAPPGELSEASLERLIDMANDAASAPRQTFPGNVQVRRRQGRIESAP
jgi:tRNA(Ile)-lysidine synthase